VAMRQAALVSDESALEACACSRRCAIQIDDLYLYLFIPNPCAFGLVQCHHLLYECCSLKCAVGGELASNEQLADKPCEKPMLPDVMEIPSRFSAVIDDGRAGATYVADTALARTVL